MQIVYTINTFCFRKPLYSKHWVRFVLIYHWYQLSGTFILLFNSVLRYTPITWCSSFIHWLEIFSLKIRTNWTLISMFHQYLAQIYEPELQDYFPNLYIIIFWLSNQLLAFVEAIIYFICCFHPMILKKIMYKPWYISQFIYKCRQFFDEKSNIANWNERRKAHLLFVLCRHLKLQSKEVHLLSCMLSTYNEEIHDNF